MIPVLCVVGRSGVGKTTLLEGLLEQLGSLGLAVGLVKHTHHHLELDREGSDTQRLRRAGARRVVLTGPGAAALFVPAEEELTPRQAAELASWGCDLVLLEGFKSADLPRLEVVRAGEPVLAAGQAWLTVSDRPLEDRRWLGLERLEELAGLIQREILP